MRFSVEGFDQAVLVELKLDSIDTVILRWFVDFMATDRMVAKDAEDGRYYWVKYQSVIEDLPYLGITNVEVMARRFRKICDAGVLKSWMIKKANGTFTCFRIDPDNYRRLSSHSMQKSSGALDVSVVNPLDSKVDPKDSSIKNNSSIKNIGPEPLLFEAPPTRRITDAFQDQFLKACGHKPTWGAKEGQMIKRMLANHDVVEVIEAIGKYFAMDWWFAKNGERQFGAFAQHFDEIVSSKEKGGAGKQKLTNEEAGWLNRVAMG